VFLYPLNEGMNKGPGLHLQAGFPRWGKGLPSCFRAEGEREGGTFLYSDLAFLPEGGEPRKTVSCVEGLLPPGNTDRRKKKTT